MTPAIAGGALVITVLFPWFSADSAGVPGYKTLGVLSALIGILALSLFRRPSSYYHKLLIVLGILGFVNLFLIWRKVGFVAIV